MIVLDTHALIWVLEGSSHLGQRAARLANRTLATDKLLTSAITFWELSLLVSRGRLRLTLTPEAFHARVLNLGIQEAPITGAVALRAAGLAGSLGDPADCLIAATAILHDAKILTADARLLESRVVATVDARR